MNKDTGTAGCTCWPIQRVAGQSGFLVVVSSKGHVLLPVKDGTGKCEYGTPLGGVPGYRAAAAVERLAAGAGRRELRSVNT